MDVFNLTAHQLDTIRTLATVIGSIGGFLGGISAVFAFLARRWAKRAFDNTSTQDWQSGELRTTSVAESARHAAINGAATRQEINDLASWIKGTGRRRQPTSEIQPIKESHYE